MLVLSSLDLATPRIVEPRNNLMKKTLAAFPRSGASGNSKLPFSSDYEGRQRNERGCVRERERERQSVLSRTCFFLRAPIPRMTNDNNWNSLRVMPSHKKSRSRKKISDKRRCPFKRSRNRTPIHADSTSLNCGNSNNIRKVFCPRAKTSTNPTGHLK